MVECEQGGKTTMWSVVMNKEGRLRLWGLAAVVWDVKMCSVWCVVLWEGEGG